MILDDLHQITNISDFQKIIKESSDNYLRMIKLGISADKASQSYISYLESMINMMLRACNENQNQEVNKLFKNIYLRTFDVF